MVVRICHDKKRRGYSLAEVCSALLLLAFVSILVQKTIKNSTANYGKARLQSDLDKEHFTALQKLRQPGELKTRLKQALIAEYGSNSAGLSQYASLIDCFENIGSNCKSFDRSYNLLNSLNDNTLNASVDRNLVNCPDPANCNDAYLRDTSVSISCPTDESCSGLKIQIRSLANNEQERKIASMTPLSSRVFDVEISPTELTTSKLKGLCGEGMVVGINKATNKVECASAESTANFVDLNNTCVPSFDSSGAIPFANAGVKESGLNQTGCQQIRLATWNEAASWPSPIQSKPNLDILTPLEAGIKKSEEVPVIGDLYLIVDTSGSMSVFRKKMAEGVADIVSQVRSNANNSINIYLYPITSFDNEAISNELTTTETPVPNSENKILQYEYKLKKPFASFLSGENQSRDEIINAIENAPTPSIDNSGNARESGLCSIMRLANMEHALKENSVQKDTSVLNVPRRKFIIFLTDEADELDKQGTTVRSLASNTCTHSMKEELYPIYHNSYQEKRYNFIDKFNVSMLSTNRPSNANRKEFIAYGVTAYLTYKYKTVSEDLINSENPDGVSEHVTYAGGLKIVPSEYSLENTDPNKLYDCPSDLKADLSKFMGPQIKDSRNLIDHYYSTESRKNEALEIVECKYYGVPLGWWGTFDLSNFANAKDFFDFNFFTTAGTTVEGIHYENMLDFLNKDHNASVLNDLKYNGATKAIMQSSTENNNYKQYWNRVKELPINQEGGPPLSAFILDLASNVQYSESYIHTEPAWVHWASRGRSFISEMQRILNILPKAEDRVDAYSSTLDIGELVRKGLDTIFGDDYAVTAIIPTANSACIEAGRLSPIYQKIMEKMPFDRKETVDICSSASNYVATLKKALDFFSFYTQWEVKTYDYTVEVSDTTQAKALVSYFNNNEDAELIVSLYDPSSNECEDLSEDIDFTYQIVDGTNTASIKIKFVKNELNKKRLLKYKGIRLSLK